MLSATGARGTSNVAKRIKRTQIVDAVSGEILREERETVYTSEAYKPGVGYRLYSRKHIRLGKKWDKTMTLHEWGLLVKLLLIMDENNELADIGTISAHFGLSRRRVYQVLSGLRQHGAIAKVSGGYVVNPVLAFAGTYLSPQLYRLFEPDLAKVVPGWAKLLYQKEG